MKVRYFLDKNGPPLKFITGPIPPGAICMYQFKHLFERPLTHVTIYYEDAWEEAVEELHAYMYTRNLIEDFLN